MGLVLIFLAVPPLRRHCRPAAERPTPALWSLAASLSMGLALLLLHATWLTSTSLPPTAQLHPDVWFHMSLNHELARGVVPQIPQVAGEVLQYHWFANALMAADSMATGVAASSVLLHLWPVAMVMTLWAAVAALSMRVSGKWWAAGVAATGSMTVTTVVVVYAVPVGLAPSAFLPTSPSAVLGTAMVLGGAAAIVELIRGPRRAGPWVSAMLCILAGAGAKPTVLPLLVTGTVTAAVFLVVRRRGVPWRLLVLACLMLTTLMASLHTVVGSSAGSDLRLLGYLRFLTTYRESTGDRSVPGTGGWTVPGLLEGGWDDRVLAASLLAGLILYQLPRLVGLLALTHPGTRSDPVVWFLSGAVGASLAAFLLLDHPSLSEVHFLVTAIPLGVLLSTHLLVHVLPQTPHRNSARAVVGVVAGGALLALTLMAWSGAAGHSGSGSSLRPVTLPVGVCAAGVTLAVSLATRLPRIRRGLSASAIVVLFVLGLATPGVVASATPALIPSMGGDSARHDPGHRIVTAAEQRAASWLREHSGPDDVVVTNVHCVQPVQESHGCDSRAFWLSGLSGRRLLLEGWAYTQANLATNGENGRSFEHQPSPWPERLRLSRQAVEAPAADALTRLRRAHGVRWLFVNARASSSSARLTRLAPRRYRNADVRVFELRP